MIYLAAMRFGESSSKGECTMDVYFPFYACCRGILVQRLGAPWWIGVAAAAVVTESCSETAGVLSNQLT